MVKEISLVQATYSVVFLACYFFLGSACAIDSAIGTVKVLRVGPQEKFTSPSLAAKLAKDGDVIEIVASGHYDGDVAVWGQNNLTIRGVNGRPHIRASGSSAEGKAVWVVKGDNTTIENIEISGTRVSDGNGAAIRQEGSGLTLRHCYFHHNENGILAGENKKSDIVIEHSEFSDNGAGSGQTHNIYIGDVRTFTLKYSYSHHARVGHNVKSRAQTNYILYNRLMDGADGNSSYIVDLPNGGLSYVIGNEIQQGPQADNWAMVAYGKEGLSNPQRALYIVNNTFVNDRNSGVFVSVAGESEVKLINNLLVGEGQTAEGTVHSLSNVKTKKTKFVDRKGFDYRLSFGSPAIDRGIVPGNAAGFSLNPVSEYTHAVDFIPRKTSGLIDVGAHEYLP